MERSFERRRQDLWSYETRHTISKSPGTTEEAHSLLCEKNHSPARRENEKWEPSDPPTGESNGRQPSLDADPSAQVVQTVEELRQRHASPPREASRTIEPGNDSPETRSKSRMTRADKISHQAEEEASMG